MNIVSCSVYYSKALAGGTFPALRKFNYVERNSEKIKQKSKAKKKKKKLFNCSLLKRHSQKEMISRQGNPALTTL